MGKFTLSKIDGPIIPVWPMCLNHYIQLGQHKNGAYTDKGLHTSDSSDGADVWKGNESAEYTDSVKKFVYAEAGSDQGTDMGDKEFKLGNDYSFFVPLLASCKSKLTDALILSNYIWSTAGTEPGKDFTRRLKQLIDKFTGTTEEIKLNLEKYEPISLDVKTAVMKGHVEFLDEICDQESYEINAVRSLEREKEVTHGSYKQAPVEKTMTGFDKIKKVMQAALDTELPEWDLKGINPDDDLLKPKEDGSAYTLKELSKLDLYHSLYESKSSVPSSDLPQIVGYILAISTENSAYLIKDSTGESLYNQFKDRKTNQKFEQGGLFANMKTAQDVYIAYTGTQTEVDTYAGYGSKLEVKAKIPETKMSLQLLPSFSSLVQSFHALSKEATSNQDYPFSRRLWFSLGMTTINEVAATHSEFQGAMYLNAGYSIWKTATRNPASIPKVISVLDDIGKNKEEYMELFNQVSLHTATCGVWFNKIQNTYSVWPKYVNLCVYYWVDNQHCREWATRCGFPEKEIGTVNGTKIVRALIPFPSNLIYVLLNSVSLRINAFGNLRMKNNKTAPMNRLKDATDEAKNSPLSENSYIDNVIEQFTKKYQSMFKIGAIWLDAKKSLDLTLEAAAKSHKDDDKDKKKPNTNSGQTTTATTEPDAKKKSSGRGEV